MDALHLAVRWLHIVAGASLLGGALVLALASALHIDAGRELFWAVARRYEWLFWASLGLVVASGVGNLGAMGVGLPTADSEWGRVLLAKLALVLALATASVVRTALVARLERQRAAPPPLLRGLYIATAVAALAVFALAEVLAHG